jgi:CheY-like chemotaxis protein
MFTILIIEDDTAIIENLVELLQEEGYKPIAATSGKDGLVLARSFMPDLILCDISMPEMDGYQVLEEIREDAQMVDTPFIFLSAKSDKIDIRRGMNLGANDYLAKPCRLRDILEAISSQIANRDRLQKQIETLCRTREDKVRRQMLKEIPDYAGNFLNQIMGCFQLLQDEEDPDERSRLIEDGLQASGKAYGHLWAMYRAIEKI